MFLSKAELEATVKAYDLDVTGLNWPQKQGYVSKYLAANNLEVVKPEVSQEVDVPRRQSAFAPTEGQLTIDDVIDPNPITPEEVDRLLPLTDTQRINRERQGDMAYPSAAFITMPASHTPEQYKDGLADGTIVADSSWRDRQLQEQKHQGDMASHSAASFSEPMDVVPPRLRAEYEANAHMHIPTPGEPVIIKGKAKRIQLETLNEITDEWLALGLKNKRLMFAPEILTDPNRLIRYREDLGPNARAEDVNYTGEDLDRRNIQGAPGTSNGISGTYKVTDIPDERCIATSTIPKYNAAIFWDFGSDGKPVTYFPIVEFEGRRGYLYKHATIPNVYSAIFDDPRLREHGYFQRFRENLSQEPYVFYLAGLLAIDIDFTHYMMEEISREERRRND